MVLLSEFLQKQDVIDLRNRSRINMSKANEYITLIFNDLDLSVQENMDFLEMEQKVILESLRKVKHPKYIIITDMGLFKIRMKFRSSQEMREVRLEQPYKRLRNSYVNGDPSNVNDYLKFLKRNMDVTDLQQQQVFREEISNLITRLNAFSYGSYGEFNSQIVRIHPNNEIRWSTSTSNLNPHVFYDNDNDQDRDIELFEKLKKRYNKSKFNEKYGVELEFEPIKNISHDKIKKMDGDIFKVCMDGSLSDIGFEVVSKPFESLKTLEKYTHKLLEKIEDKVDLVIGETAAIHYHVSNHKNPTGVFLLCKYFGNVFEDIRLSKNNKLTHNRLSRPRKVGLIHDNGFLFSHEDNEWFKKSMDNGYDPYIAKRNIYVGRRFQTRGRRSTLRATGVNFNGDHPESDPKNTLEFRIFPQTNQHSLYHIYPKIIKNILKKTNKNSWEDIYDETMEMGNPHYKRYKEFEEVCDLNGEEVEELFKQI